ncbi:GntR family transcriptional regulator [Streptomyces sp. NPDC057684]|uniref:GntR family transcriptional regulator n=1 Tax=Streptomyces sp. NPDC057684 TaxID=3346211 RepID=UPI0036CB6B93
MARGSDASSARIAADLALAIQQGKIPPGQKLPTQAQLAQTYGAALPTVGAALTRLTNAQLIKQEGRYRYVRPARSVFPASPVRDILTAASVCAHLSATYTDPAPANALGRWPADTSLLRDIDRHLLAFLGTALMQGPSACSMPASTRPGSTTRCSLLPGRSCTTAADARLANWPSPQARGLSALVSIDAVHKATIPASVDRVRNRQNLGRRSAAEARNDRMSRAPRSQVRHPSTQPPPRG